jgi:hypothetical protein
MIFEGIMTHCINFESKSALPTQEFEFALTAHPLQQMPKDPVFVNELLATLPEERKAQLKKTLLTKSELWEGLIEKAYRPHDFTSNIVASVKLPTTLIQNPGVTSFERLSVQPCWITNRLIFVKEETHVFHQAKKVLFLGREVSLDEAKQYLFEPFLEQVFNKKPGEQVAFNGMKMNVIEARQYYTHRFASEFDPGKTPLFHVEHAAVGEENNPVETWRFVRLAIYPSDPLEQAKVEELRKNMAEKRGTIVYERTIEHLMNKEQEKETLNPV